MTSAERQPGLVSFGSLPVSPALEIEMTLAANRTRSLSIVRDAMVIAAAVFAILGATARR